MTSSPDRPPEMPRHVAWFSAHGMKVLGVLLLIELLFHAYAVTSAKRREATPKAQIMITGE